MIQPWNLVTTNLSRLREQSIDVVVLPTAAIEPHNRHLPEGQDVLHTTHVAREAVKQAWERGAKVLLLPTIPFGVDCNLMDFPMAIHVQQSTLNAVVKDIVLSLRKHGIRKVVILNGHGGNDFVPLIRQLQCESDLFLFLIDWWQVGKDCYGDIFERPDDHAGEMETSVALALFPELVEMDRAEHGRARPFRFEALEKGWAKTSRTFAKLNDHCAAGEPHLATAEKGRKYLNIVIDRISHFLIELGKSPIDDMFPMADEKV